jgi:hypothetical protein
MMDEDIRAIALFFYYSLLDDQLALRATAKAIKKLSRRAQRELSPQGETSEVRPLGKDLVRVCFRLWRGLERFAPRGGSGGTPTLHWHLPENLDLAPWRQFQREGLSEDMIAVVWSKIIGYPEAIIAQGLDLTPGTVRYRVARGVRQLGQTNRLGKYVGI